MNESLFDTRFGADNTPAPEASEAPLAESPASSAVSFRVLVSDKESGCLIGQNGQVIDSIREETNTKAAISRLLPGSHERILTVSGTLDGSVLALLYFAQALCNTAAEQYTFFPLKQLSSNPTVEGQSTVLRVLIPNSQIGSLIGSKGLRIQQIQSDFDISMIVSKSFLPASNERLVELQGAVDNLSDALRAIAQYLIEDSADISGTIHYDPKGAASNGRNSNQSSNLHSTRSEERTPRARQGSAATITVNIPNHMVGAMIGKLGMRIQGVRKVSGANIAISDEVSGEEERIFTISGSPTAVEKAKDLLHHNYEREEQRRADYAAGVAASDAAEEQA